MKEKLFKNREKQQAFKEKRTQSFTRLLVVLSFGLPILLLCLGCAKERALELFPDPENLIYGKAGFLTSDGTHQNFWFQKVTVTHLSEKSFGRELAHIGLQSSMKMGFFNFSDEEMRFYNALSQNTAVSIDDRLGSLKLNVGPKKNVTTEGGVLNELVHSWGIEHIDFRLETNDGKTTNREENNPYLRRDEKSSFKINWNEFKINEARIFPGYWDEIQECWNKINSNIESDSLEFSKDYFGFTLIVDYEQSGKRECIGKDTGQILSESFITTIHYKYSFRRVKERDLDPNQYVPYVYNTKTEESTLDLTSKNYGFFPVSVQYIDSENQLKNRILMTRWNPERNHIFYFTKGFPEKYKQIFKDIFSNLNKLFVDNNLPVRFEIKENTGQELGDLRYSFVHIEPSSSTEAPLGYGPSDANPITGEIISATTVIWSRPFDRIVNVLLKDQLPRMKEKNLNQENIIRSIVQNLRLQSPDATLAGKPFNLLRYFVRESSKFIRDEEDESKPDEAKVSWNFDRALKHLTYTPPTLWAEGGYIPAMPQHQQMNPPLNHMNHMNRPIIAFGGFSPLGLQMSFKSQTTHSHAFSEDGLSLAHLIRQLRGGQSSDRNENNYRQRLSDLFIQGDQDIKEYLFHSRESIDKARRSSGSHRSLVTYPSDFLDSESYAGILPSGFPEEKIDAVVEKIQKGDIDDLISKMIYGVAIHEVGHNLGLRHNFMGSLDKKNFRTKNSFSSSVMEYKDLFSRVFTEDNDWGIYDKAALLYAYSGKGRNDESRIDLAIEKNKNYLYCSDLEQLNVLCGLWDRGTTFSESILNTIVSYINSYYIRNLRAQRPFWNPEKNRLRVLRTMVGMKNFLMATSGFTAHDLQRHLSLVRSDEEKNRMIEDIRSDLIFSNVLAAAFLDAVIQIPLTDRNFNNQYENYSGFLESSGILYDKIYALLILLGSHAWPYNYNKPIYHRSYYEIFTNQRLIDYTPYQNLVERIVQDRITNRVDMVPWFTNIARIVFALDARQVSNRQNTYLLEGLGVQCYKSAAALKNNLIADDKFDPHHYTPLQLSGEPIDFLKPRDLNFEILNLNQYNISANDEYFTKSQHGSLVSDHAIKEHFIGVVKQSNWYYVMSAIKNPYSYSIVKTKFQENESQSSDSLREAKQDIIELYQLYNVIQGRDPASRCIE